VLFLEWDFGNLDYGPIAARIKDAKPDFLWVGSLGLEGVQLLEALAKIDYTPTEHFYIYPAPGPTSKSPLAKNALSITLFEEHPPFTNNPGSTDFIKIYHERAAKAGIPDTSVEVQAAVSYVAWQLLEAGVKGAGSLDDKAIGQWLKTHRVDTIVGKLRFDGPSNYGDDLMRVKQVQNGRWVTVWPKEYAAPGASLQVQ
jgi:branched-chain amino acid transport system substrate-binding protein